MSNRDAASHRSAESEKQKPFQFKVKAKVAYVGYLLFAASTAALALDREGVALTILAVSVAVFFLGPLLGFLHKK